ncbi:MAG: hypothetical protein NUV60_02940 [Patescibacteria group bacterium]|nr:hypothetical protein [Patescibacteria group bacterium]
MAQERRKKSSVREVEWREVPNYFKGLGSILEEKDRMSADVRRGRLVRVAYDNRRLHFELNDHGLFTRYQGSWVKASCHVIDIFTMMKDMPPPLVLADGRILFTFGNTDVTIYPPGFDVDCP